MQLPTIQHIPKTKQERVVIVGGGFAGLELAQRLDRRYFQVVLIDRHNFHMFQPLFYQVATAGLEPSAISFPFRKVFQRRKRTHFRMAEVLSVEPGQQTLHTSIGSISYDHLVLCMGATTNYFGNANIARHALPMKSVGEALYLRNTILNNYEAALNTTNAELQKALMNIVVVGGGPTGVELAGALAEMKKYILPKDYPELDLDQMQVFLLEGSDRVLPTMSAKASGKALRYLKKLDVQVQLNSLVTEFDGVEVQLREGTSIRSNSLIWAAGVICPKLKGIPEAALERGNRIQVDTFNRVEGSPGIFVLGDQAFMQENGYERGHPQVAQTAIQQARTLAKNLRLEKKGKAMKPFRYKDKGSLATVGRNLAVADLPALRFGGFLAWLVWMFVHLMSIVGVKNRLLIFVNWAWNYMTYDQSLRLLIKPDSNKIKDKEQQVESSTT